MAHARRALELALAYSAKGDEAWARYLLGRIHLASGPAAMAEAVTQLDSALRLAFACEARPLAALCRSALGTVHGRRGDEAGGRKFVAAANALYTELDMRPLPFDQTR